MTGKTERGKGRRNKRGRKGRITGRGGEDGKRREKTEKAKRASLGERTDRERERKGGPEDRKRGGERESGTWQGEVQ